MDSHKNIKTLTIIIKLMKKIIDLPTVFFVYLSLTNPVRTI